jgi:hypothetical protein
MNKETKMLYTFYDSKEQFKKLADLLSIGWDIINVNHNDFGLSIAILEKNNNLEEPRAIKIPARKKVTYIKSNF